MRDTLFHGYDTFPGLCNITDCPRLNLEKIEIGEICHDIYKGYWYLDELVEVPWLGV
jgi:hypothetical protein